MTARRRERARGLVQACALLCLAAGAAAAAWAPHPTYGLLSSTLPPRTSEFGVRSADCDQLQVAPQRKDFGTLRPGESRHGPILRVVRQPSGGLPLSASVTGPLASAMSVAVTPDQTEVQGFLRAPSVATKTTLDGTIVVSFGNDWCTVEVPAALTVVPLRRETPSVAEAVYGMASTASARDAARSDSVSGSVHGAPAPPAAVTAAVYGPSS